MNICDIAFSTEWFLTIPGMLITGGVILLIIALIMLLISSSKGKKKKVQQNGAPVSDMNTGIPAMGATMSVQDNMAGIGAMPSADMGVMPDMPAVSEQMVTPQPTVEPVAPVEPTLEIQDPVSVTSTSAMPDIPAMQMPGDVPGAVSSVGEIGPTPVAAPFQVNPTPEVVPVTDTMQQPVGNDVVTPAVDVIPTVEPTPVVSPAPVMDIPTIEPVATVEPIPTVEPVVNPIPNVEVVSTETIPVPGVPTMDSVQAFNNLSSGNVEQNSFGSVPVQEEARPIYGGANPLEATQNLPKIDVHHEPYSGGREVVQEPVVEQPAVTPAFDTIPTIPVVESMPATEVAMPEAVNPVEVNSMGSVPMSDSAPVVPPMVEPTPAVAPVQPTMVTPNYGVAQPTSPVVDVEQL